MRFILLILVFSAAVALKAQEKDTIRYSLATPYDAVITHLQYLQPNSYYPEIASKALKKDERSNEEIASLAIKLKQIFDGSGEYIDVDEIPRVSNYKDSL
ncbi:MAG: mechanosensitive ion channel family protein, partial [Fulvivirga sp.]